MTVSKTRIDRLGDRLKSGSHTESDLRLLDDYRRSFGEAYEAVIQTIRQRGEFPSGRPAKSTVSVVEKLCRESIRLSQVQDIAGCRVVVLSVVAQEQVVASLRTAFAGASVIDRRDNPTYGYRAVHVIAEMSGKPVEIQIRTSLQHLWAELSEKSSDVLDPSSTPSIKYGGGPAEWRSFLRMGSESVAAYEKFEKTHAEAQAAHEEFEKAIAELLEHPVPDHELRGVRGRLEDSKRKMVDYQKEKVRLLGVNTDLLTRALTWLEERKGQKQ